MHQLLRSMLELAESTSENLDYSYRKDIHIGYGEETITETNLLELRRLNPTTIWIKTFGKRTEAKNGADWEWWIVGKHWTLTMRVQAKRVDCNGRVRNIDHKTKGYSKTQSEILIEDADKNNLTPMYCFFCADKHRTKWAKSKNILQTEYGCLLASAQDVIAKKSGRSHPFSNFEEITFPWHYLLLPGRHGLTAPRLLLGDNEDYALFLLRSDYQAITTVPIKVDDEDMLPFPTAEILNKPQKPPERFNGIRSSAGIEKSFQGSDSSDKNQSFLKRGILGRMVVDLRD